MSYIERAILEISNICNLNCLHCYGPFSNHIETNSEDWKNIIDELEKLGCKEYTLSGGEPLLNPNLVRELLYYLKDKKKSVVLTTNGTLFNQLEIEDYKRFDLIQISMDGSQNLHDYIRGKGTYDKVCQMIMELKKDIDPKKIRIMMTVNNLNVNDFKNVFEFSKNNDLNMGIERVCGVGNAEDKNINNLDKVDYKNILEFSNANNIYTNDPLMILINDKNNCACSAGADSIVIDSNLDCFMCTKYRVSIGNVKVSKLSDIISNMYNNYNLGDPRELKGKCKNCEFSFSCGGCRAAAFAKFGDIFQEDPFCWK